MNKFLTKYLNIRMPEKLFKDGEKLADSKGKPIASFVRHLIVKAIEKHKKKQEKDT